MKQYQPIKVEEDILEFWKANKIYEKAKEKNKGKKQFYFLQGPPYTSGRIHMGHAWNMALKDMVLRYKRMQGFDVWDRGGYDMHGLPTSRQVMKEQNLRFKDDIIKFGMDKFVNECLKFSIEKMKLMNKDFWRLGVWMDHEGAYKPIKNEYIESVWFLVKKAHETGRLYEGLRTMAWCASCETALAKHEQEYKNVEDDSIFLKFKVIGKENEYLIIWTTTPWTIPFNLAVMVNPELEYIKAKVDGEIWIMAKGLAGPLVQSVVGKSLIIIEEFPGSELAGLKYEHPLAEEIKFFEKIKNNPKLHTVILSKEYVDLSAGSGLVHCAPGCGPEDYEVGHQNGLPPFNNLDEQGTFPKDMGKFAGWVAKKDDKKFIEELDKKGVLIATTKVQHDYAHCERCHKPVIFKTTKQWFFRTEDLKQQMIDVNEKTYWVPETTKNAFRSWLENLRDNSITKQRFWGTPIPIWRCECGKYVVIEKREDIEKLGGKVPDNLHKPWIDEVELDCECGKKMKRVPDVIDVWVDAGCASWACLDYPHRENLFEKWFPADFILEAKEQVRGWYNLLMVASMIALKKTPYKTVYSHGMLTDVEGVKMSKSLGNIISPYEVIDKHGVDTLRYYCIGTKAGEDMNFSWDEIALKYRYLAILWNIHNYLVDISNTFNVNPKELKSDVKDVEERYILSKTNSAIRKMTDKLEAYNLDTAPGIFEELVLELSRTYIQFVRDKIAIGKEDERNAAIKTVYYVLFAVLRIGSPIVPFITEKIFQNLKSAFGVEGESIHHLGWPEADENMIDATLEKDFEVAKAIIQSILSGRNKLKLTVRWPLKEVVIATLDDGVHAAVKQLEGLIKMQTNVKEIKIVKQFDKVKKTMKADFNKFAPVFSDKTPKIIAHLSMVTPEQLAKQIENEGKFVVNLDGETFEITKELMIVEKIIDNPYVGVEFKFGEVYLNRERNDELDAEGYAREIMRRVQNARKKAGLSKVDRISLFVRVSSDLLVNLQKWEKAVGEKVGARAIRISDKEPAKKHKNKESFTVKDEIIEIMFDVI